LKTEIPAFLALEMAIPQLGAISHLRISPFQLKISEMFISSNSVKNFALSRVQTAFLESHSPALYHRTKLNCFKKKPPFYE